MKKTEWFVFCQKEVKEFGVTYFKKGVYYQAKQIYDLFLFTGEKKNIIQIENHETNTWFNEHFRLILSKKSTLSLKEEKIEKEKKRA